MKMTAVVSVFHQIMLLEVIASFTVQQLHAETSIRFRKHSVFSYLLRMSIVFISIKCDMCLVHGLASRRLASGSMVALTGQAIQWVR